MYQVQQISTRTVITAHLTQTMSLLHQSVAELWEKIQTELTNPALELVEERRCPMCHRLLNPSDAVCPVCSQPRGGQGDEIIVFVSTRDDILPVGGSEDREEEIEPEERLFSEGVDLATHVLRQVVFDLEPDEQRIAAHLVSSLDGDGLFVGDLEEVARYFHSTLAEVERVRQVLMRADPVGVGAFSPQEAMLVQIEALKEVRRVPDAAEAIVQKGLDLLARHQYSELARRLGFSLDEIRSAAAFISDNLNPYPARTFWGDMRAPTAERNAVYTYPDIIISHLNDDPEGPLVVEIVMPLKGTLRVNPLYRQIVQQAEGETREELRADLERAALFLKCLQQRNHTLLRLMRRVVELQRDYILHGERHLKSITRSQMARELGLHESTISRAVAQKCVQLPNKRIVPLASFFDRNGNVRSALRELIANERQPLSDSEIAERLAQQGFRVARRTVAKYRAMEGILPAHLRRAPSTNS